MLFAVAHIDASACTSAIVSAKRSSEGAPLLWKHRDWRENSSRVKHFEGGKYAYTAVVSTKPKSRSVYAGINEAGFGIINTATKNLPQSSEEEYGACDRKAVSFPQMWHYGLRNCATVDEFEEYLRNTKRNRKFNTNIGVADATGAVAYFEIWDLDYRRFDVSEQEEGFDVRANFSFAGNEAKRGKSTRRYDITMEQMSAHKGVFTPQDFCKYSRSFNSCAYGDILKIDKEYICDNYCVPRYTTTGVFVIVCDAKCPRMLVAIGHSVPGVVVPIYVQSKHHIPECVHGDAMRLLSNDFREKAYTTVAEGKHRLEKEVVSRVLRIKQPKIEMPATMPADIESFNSTIDNLYAKYEKRVRKALAKF